MNNFFDECLRNKKLIKFPRAKTFVDREFKEATSDLSSAKESLKTGNYKWSTIQTYFSMFHCARSLIYKAGYREKNHFCLIEALRTIYLNNRLIDHKIVEDIQLAKRMREAADYNADFSEDAAEALIKSAEKLLTTTNNIIKSN